MLSIEGLIVNTDGQTRRRVEINTGTGLITNVSEPTGMADLVLKDELIFPGFIDLHVHAREDAGHSQDYKEDYITAGEAAIHGGVVAFCDMPNNPVPPVDDASYDAKNALTKKSDVEILVYACIGPNTNPLSKKVPYKVYMTKSGGIVFFEDFPALDATLAKYQGQSVSFHCEDPKMIASHQGESTHEAQRPVEAEISAVDFALEMIEKYKLVGKICHASTVEGIAKIVEAKKRGVHVTVEVTPHHLYFDETMISASEEIMFQVNPPIRQTKENRLALIEALKNGDIDYLATDHAPHTIEEKKRGMSGFPHLDTYGAFATWLMTEHRFSTADIARVCSKNPGSFVNEFLPDKHGKIEVGYIGSLSIIEPGTPYMIRAEISKQNAGGRRLKVSHFRGE